jgi:hypothetical protein
MTQRTLQERIERAAVKKQEAEDGMSQYLADQSAVLQRTARLRELRLAKEAEDAAAQLSEPKPKTQKRS